MHNALYLVDRPRKTNYAEAAPTQLEYDYEKFISCPHCGNRVSGAYWKRPREIVVTSRNTPDFLYTYGDNTPFLLSEKALNLVLKAGLTGINRVEKIESARFQRKSNKDVPLPSYYHIELVRSQITIDHQNSNIKYGRMNGPTCPLCRQVPATYNFTRKLSFHMDAYEGYDIFQIYELGNQVFLSQSFVDLCVDNKLTNLHYTIAERHDSWAAEYFLDGNEDA